MISKQQAKELYNLIALRIQAEQNVTTAQQSFNASCSNINNFINSLTEEEPPAVESIYDSPEPPRSR